MKVPDLGARQLEPSRLAHAVDASKKMRPGTTWFKTS
jgi:hypothetical protein